MPTRPAESPGRPLERHGNVSPREMTVHGVSTPGQNPAYRPAHSPLVGRPTSGGRAQTLDVLAADPARAMTQNAVVRTQMASVT